MRPFFGQRRLPDEGWFLTVLRIRNSPPALIVSGPPGPFSEAAGKPAGDLPAAPLCRRHSAWAERRSQLRGVGPAIVDVMPGVDDQDAIDAPGRETRIVWRHQPGHDLAELILDGPRPEMLDHVGFDVEGQHLSLRTHRARQGGFEEPGAGAEVDHGHARCNRHQRDHVVRLLPGCSLGAVEALLVLRHVAEVVLHAGTVNVDVVGDARRVVRASRLRVLAWAIPGWGGGARYDRGRQDRRQQPGAG